MTALPGVAWIVGCPQSGKTTLARWEASRLSRERGWPVLVIDAASVHNLADVPSATVDEAISALWKEPRGSARIAPRSLEEVDRACRAVRAGKRVVLLVDEAHYFLSAQSGVSSELLRLMRATQHAQAEVLLTTHHLTGDVPQSALSCTSRLLVFRCTSPRVLRVLETEFGFPRQEVRELPQYHYRVRSLGFDP